MKIDFNQLKHDGFVNEPIDEKLDLVAEIKRMKAEKNAVILGHYYIEAELQEIADFVGDSLALSQKAAETDAEMIVFLGVHFMAETAKILSPSKKVIIPDLKADCSLAQSCQTADFAAFVAANPDHTVISYVNTTAEIKAYTDICCTSSNAKEIVESLPKDTKIIFAPDRNLGNYINSVTGREMLLWNGACHVHNEISLEKVLELKKQFPHAKLISHPESTKPVLLVSDYVGSTAQLLKFSQTDPAQTYIVATEWGILHQMKKASPHKEFIPAPGEDASCACSECSFMKINSLKKLYLALKHEQPEVLVDAEVSKKAYKSIKRMLDISEKLGL